MPERYRPPSEEELRAHLAERQARYADLQARGIDAMSRYDIEIAHGGNAEQALDTALWLVGNHIAYYSRLLEPYDAAPKQQSFIDLIEEECTDE